MSRRKFLAAIGATAAAAALASCGDKVTNYYGSAGPTASTLVERRMNLYSWADYTDPELLSAWGDTTVAIYNSSEDLIKKLTAANGKSGFDVVEPTGMFIPEMVRRGLLEQLDLSKIPNFNQLDAQYIDQPWDRKNTYSVCKAWGTVGWLYDSSVVTKPIATWNDFIEAAKGEASGKTSLLDAPIDSTGLYFWANDLEWDLTNTEAMAASKAFLLNDLAPHLAGLDSAPQGVVADTPYALSQVFNGDARRCLLALKEAGQDESKWKWGVGAPKTELWMDNYCIVKGARHKEAAYDYINFMLDPLNAARDAMFVGANTGTASLRAMLPSELPHQELMFFTPEELARMIPGTYSKGLDEAVAIHAALSEKTSAGIPVKG
jgi:spermidine/putrescine transport system substrate-binding protein